MYRKKILICLLLIMVLLVSGCNKNKGNDEDFTPEVLEGTHTIIEKDLDIYLLVQGKPVDNELKYAITIYSDFKKEERTSRHYSYYQVDYYTNELNQYYHFFDYATDGTERSYAQQFLPYNKLSDKLKEIIVMFEYSFMIGEVVYEEKCTFKEEMINFDENIIYLQEINEYSVNISKTLDEDKNSRFKLSININHDRVGHLDFTAFVKLSDGNIYPLYGLYHYNFDRGNYLSVSDTVIKGDIEIENVYYVFNEYLTDGTKNNIYFME